MLRKTVFKMKQILASSTRDPVKIQVAKQKVKQARLKAERDYLRTVSPPPWNNTARDPSHLQCSAPFPEPGRSTSFRMLHSEKGSR